jgi:hypothetical protein
MKKILLIGAGGLGLYLAFNKMPKFKIVEYDNTTKRGVFSWNGINYEFGKGYKNQRIETKLNNYSLEVNYNGGFGTYATFQLYKNNTYIKELQRIAL